MNWYFYILIIIFIFDDLEIIGLVIKDVVDVLVYINDLLILIVDLFVWYFIGNILMLDIDIVLFLMVKMWILKIFFLNFIVVVNVIILERKYRIVFIYNLLLGYELIVCVCLYWWFSSLFFLCLWLIFFLYGYYLCLF